jgi:hypothetical protein
MTGKSIIVPVALCMLSGFFGSCVPIKAIFKKPKPYAYGWVPKKYEEVSKHYSDYAHWYNCKSGETIASIGAGNGKFEVAISCFMPDINWYLQEIDTLRLYQFDDVLAHFEKLKQSPIDATFHLVVGTESETNLPQSTFDRILMINVVHEINDREPSDERNRQIIKAAGQIGDHGADGRKGWSGAWRLQVSKTAGERPAARNERLRFSVGQQANW